MPAGAIPKDGPSAGDHDDHGACVRRSIGRPVKHTVGMTGEVTLQGRVLPIGGLKKKATSLLHAAGLTDVGCRSATAPTSRMCRRRFARR